MKKNVQLLAGFIMITMIILAFFSWQAALTHATPVPEPESEEIDNDSPTVMDIDGNIYRTVRIGNQYWMAENLRTTRYQNGDPIPNVQGSDNWRDLSEGAWVHYDNDSSFDQLYGKLYNWYAVDDERGLCPTGWHVPSDEEWRTLTNFLGAAQEAGGRMKSTGTSHWRSPNTGATNDSGFNGHPGGSRTNLGSFGFMGGFGFWWTSTEYFANVAWERRLAHNGTNVQRNGTDKRNGFSVRCILSDRTEANLPELNTLPADEISGNSALSGGRIANDGGSPVTSRGIFWSTEPNPTIQRHDGRTIDGGGDGEFSSELDRLAPETTYYVRAYAINKAGIAYGNEITFESAFSYFIPGNGLTDLEGNEYKTVIIGEQEWMAENLRTGRYRNGEFFPNIADPDGWGRLAELEFGSWAYYDNDESYHETLGKLYNWYAVNDERGLCPPGWRVPSNDDWSELTSYLGENAGGKMKSTETEYWRQPNEGATNESGFNGLPGGYRTADGYYGGKGSYGFWWTSTEFDEETAWERWLFNEHRNVFRYGNPKVLGYSVRCIKN
ncbi:fibrobacter succinogenes major paralogous domain-containing protein [Balneolaceae bacterium ANBcel3]|nr:fibrobacter succinogenes major paralogous domain-containing protein [Balneolaceae bacterium ANBcel3]